MDYNIGSKPGCDTTSNGYYLDYTYCDGLTFQDLSLSARFYGVSFEQCLLECADHQASAGYYDSTRRV